MPIQDGAKALFCFYLSHVSIIYHQFGKGTFQKLTPLLGLGRFAVQLSHFYKFGKLQDLGQFFR